MCSERSRRRPMSRNRHPSPRVILSEASPPNAARVMTVRFSSANKALDVPPTAYHHSHACCCTLFLCAYYCHPSVTRSHVESWTSRMEPLRADRIANSVSKRVIDWDDQFSLPEPLFLLNIFSLALRQQAGLTEQSCGRSERQAGECRPESRYLSAGSTLHCFFLPL